MSVNELFEALIVRPSAFTVIVPGAVFQVNVAVWDVPW